jgi:hypothetical protein
VSRSVPLECRDNRPSLSENALDVLEHPDVIVPAFSYMMRKTLHLMHVEDDLALGLDTLFAPSRTFVRSSAVSLYYPNSALAL